MVPRVATPLRLFVAVVIASLAACGAGAPATRAAEPAITTGAHVWVSVAVATLWTSPTAPRTVDAPALQSPVHIRRWLAAMSTSLRRGLVGRVETQALYGEPLVVTATSGAWLRVVAPWQPTSRDRRGYPGWVPMRQVTTRRPAATTRIATVTRLTTWLRNSSGARVVEVSLGTRLPVVTTGTTSVRVATPTGGRLLVSSSAIAIRTPSAAALPATPSSVVATARRFLGVSYLWGGRSGFAVDCSGFTSLVYAVHGRRLPRDADDQSRAGVAISRPTRGGDLTFYGPSRAPTHVAMYVGSGMLIHAPSTGHPVQLVKVSAMPAPTRVRRVM